MIPYKLFGKYLDAVCDYRRAGNKFVKDRTPKNDEELTAASRWEIDMADSIGWPWKASQEQLDEYERIRI
jgi:phage-related minor tail protein